MQTEACESGEYDDTLYCDTSFGWHTNRQSVVVRYDPDPEPGPHVTLQSPNTIFVNDDDDAHAGTNDFENAEFDSSVADDDIVPVVVGFKSVTHPTNRTLRLLMCGLTDSKGVDIPLPSVLGVASGGANDAKFEIRHANVGCDAMNGESEL